MGENGLCGGGEGGEVMHYYRHVSVIWKKDELKSKTLILPD